MWKLIIKFNFGDKFPLGVEPIDIHGHTPGLTFYRKNELLIISDLINSQKLQYKYPEICGVFDMDEQNSIESRKKNIKVYWRK